MDVYDQLDDAVYCSDLLRYGHALSAFAQAAGEDPNRAKLLSLFYERFHQFHLTDYAWDEFHTLEAYMLCEERSAVRRFIWLSTPQKGPPAQTLQHLDDFGRQLRESFLPPEGTLIAPQAVREVLRWLDERCGFSQKVFCDKKAVIGILPYTHRAFNSQCLARFGESISLHIFLCCTREDPTHPAAPEFVLFHELAHALYVRHAQGLGIKEDAAALLDRFFHGARQRCTEDEQHELVADALAMGMMRGSPFEHLDPFTSVRAEDKEAFHQFFRGIADGLGRGSPEV